MEYSPVTHTTTERRLARLPSGQTVSVTVHRYVGAPGPTVYVQATQHGIELNGPAALRRLHGRLRDAAIAGTVIAVPVANPPAFDHRSYMSPAAYDALNPNMNRTWPGDPDGSLQQRAVTRLWELVEGVDAVVDLHSGTADMMTHVRHADAAPDARRLAEAFGTAYRFVDTVDSGEDGHAGGTLRAAAADAGVPAITAELANSGRVSPAAAETGASGVVNVLRSLDVLEANPRERDAQTVLRPDGISITATESGLFEPASDVEIGTSVAAGDTLGAVYSPSTFERLEVVTAEADGLVYSIPRGATIIAGERAVGIARRGTDARGASPTR